MLPAERRRRYRQVLEGTTCVHPASVFDAISARMAESLGFEVGMFSGSIGSGVVLGAPDLTVLTLWSSPSRSAASRAGSTCRSWSTPIMATATR